MLKVKRSNWIVPAIAGTLFFSFLLFYVCYIPLPTPKKPLKIYSTEKRHDLKEVLKKAIRKAKKSITLHSYAITDHEILSLLKKTNLPIHLYYDDKATPNLKKFEGPRFHLHPIKGRGLFHEKIWIIDQKLLFLGSTNLTTASLKMHDNLMVGIVAPSFAEELSKGRVEETFHEVGPHHLHYVSLPSQKGLEAVLNALDGAKKEVALSLFTFTHPLLVEKLIELHQRGVKVRITLDSTTARGASKKSHDLLKKGGITVKLSQGLQLHHHKSAQIDNKIFITGSANWTQAAFKKNKDFILIISFN